MQSASASVTSRFRDDGEMVSPFKEVFSITSYTIPWTVYGVDGGLYGALDDAAGGAALVGACDCQWPLLDDGLLGCDGLESNS